MPEFKVRTPDGRYFNVTVPPGTTKEAALEYAKSHTPPPQGALDPAPIVNAPGTEPGGIYDRIAAASRTLSPKGFYGPGLAAKGASALQGVFMDPETPQQKYDRTTPGLETIVNILGSVVGPQKNLLQRMLTGTAVPAGVNVLGGQGVSGAMEGAGTGAAGQGLAEIFSGLVKAGRLGSLANTARADFDKKMLAHTDKTKHDTAMLRTLEDIDKSNYEKLLGKNKEANEALKKQLTDDYQSKTATHEDLMAGSIMDQAKQSVPAWSEIPSTLQGLLSAVLGKGKALLSKAFDDALEAAKGTAQGKTVKIPLRDAQKLGIKVQELTDSDPTDLQGLLSMIAGGKGTKDLTLPVGVNAAELIDRLPGLKDQGLKSRAHKALFDADLGISPEAMTEYKVGKGTINLVDENKIFKFDTDTNQYRADRGALANGLLSRKHMDTISNREMGNHDTFDPLRIAEQGPMPPVIPSPKVPEPPPARGPLGNQPPPINPDESGAIKTIHFPGTHWTRAKVGHAVGGPLGSAVGAAIPTGLTTKAPMSSQEEVAHELIPALLGALFRTAGANEVQASERTTVTPAEAEAHEAQLALIRKSEQLGQTSLDLQIKDDPSETR